MAEKSFRPMLTCADEFHHAVTEQYRRIVEYVKPHFLLGLTATSDRMDGKNIYEICDYNVPYEISLKDAINKGMLVPFHYYGVYDEKDYSELHVAKGRYDEKELNETYIGNTRRYDLIYKYYMKYSSKRALGFCCSRLYALLLRNFLLTFLNPEINTNHAQLVFTTHDTWQLSNQLLRRDEIWFTEKDDRGVSTLYSLADFVDEDGSRIRKDESYEKNYLIGKYGAIPTLKSIEIL